MSTTNRIVVERVLFYVMLALMLLNCLVPSVGAVWYGWVLFVLAFVYALSLWWLIRREGGFGFFQPFLIGLLGAGVPAVWAMSLFTGVIYPRLMWIAIGWGFAAWLFGVLVRGKVKNSLTIGFISLRIGLFIAFGLLYLYCR